MTITIGNDVEFILTRNSVPVSSIGLIGGSKQFPRPCLRGALQEDNVLAEINIDPSETHEEWELSNTTVIKELEDVLPKDISISTLASAFYPPTELANPKAQEFGCDPDFNAWKRGLNKFKNLTGKFKMLRSAGGHVHIGIPDLEVSEKFELIKCMDAFIGLQAVMLDKDTQRKMLYGKAGAMRIKPYGVEWRVPSNFWIHDKVSRKWMFNAAMFCAENFKDLALLYNDKTIVTAINTNNVEAAHKHLSALDSAVTFPLHPRIKE